MKFKLYESENDDELEVWSDEEIENYLDYESLVCEFVGNNDGSQYVEKINRFIINLLGDDIICDHLQDDSYDDEEGEPFTWTCEDYIDYLADIGELGSENTFSALYNLADERIGIEYKDIFYLTGIDQDELMHFEDLLSTETIEKLRQRFISEHREAESHLKSIKQSAPHKNNITFSQIENEINDYMKSYFYNSYDYIERGYILRDGELVSNKDIIKGLKGKCDRHGDTDAVILKNVARELRVSEEDVLNALEISVHDANGRWGSMIGDVLGWIRINAGAEKYIAIPEKEISNDQKYALADWLDIYYSDGNKSIKVATPKGIQVTYYFDGVPERNIEPYEGLDIVNKIVKYYSSGKLEEDKK